MRPITNEINDFKTLIEEGYLFIDKTLFIKELIDDASKALLFPRPSKFGKTLNMSMLNYYFNLEYDSKYLFKGLKIMEQDEKYLNKMNKYPVVSLSFKDLKGSTYEEFIEKYKTLMKDLYEKYSYLLESDNLLKIEKDYFQRVLNKKEDRQIDLAVENLISHLREYYGEQVIVLLDEYTDPIISGYLNGYYKKINDFIKQVFVTVFKGNLNLKKGIITGIVKVSNESIFSDANNIIVYNITDGNFSTHFGFTEEEVKEVLKEYNLENTYKDVKKWYGGYLFNRNIMYNPWSILNYLKNPEHTFQSYWS